MKVAFLSDIHANFPALSAALTRIERLQVDTIIAAGDIIGRGPHPVEVIRSLKTQKIRAIRGNIENRLVELRSEPKELAKFLKKKKSKLAWTAQQLTDAAWSYLAGLPRQLELELDGFKTLVVHGDPLSDTEYIYPSITPRALKRKLRERPSPLSTQILVCGHTHIPFTKSVAGIRVVNCGSVGLTVDGDPRGSFAVCELSRPKRISCRIVRFSYPVRDVIQDIEERGVPGIGRSDYFS
jgi:putative phosphoesterase